MLDIDLYELSIEQEEYLVELLCTRGACTLDLFARELDRLCRSDPRVSERRRATGSCWPACTGASTPRKPHRLT